jgi:hypothetical protein
MLWYRAPTPRSLKSWAVLLNSAVDESALVFPSCLRWTRTSRRRQRLVVNGEGRQCRRGWVGWRTWYVLTEAATRAGTGAVADNGLRTHRDWVLDILNAL